MTTGSGSITQGSGSFFSVDPLTKSYPMLTPYQFAGNMPIWAIDLDGLEPVKSNDANWDYKPNLVNKYYPNYNGNNIHMFTYHYPVDGKNYEIIRQDWSRGDNINDFRYWSKASGDNAWKRFNLTSRIDGLSEDMSNFACFMLATAGATVGFAAIAESGALNGTLSINKGKDILFNATKDFVNQMIVHRLDIKEIIKSKGYGFSQDLLKNIFRSAVKELYKETMDNRTKANPED